MASALRGLCFRFIQGPTKLYGTGNGIHHSTNQVDEPCRVAHRGGGGSHMGVSLEITGSPCSQTDYNAAQRKQTEACTMPPIALMVGGRTGLTRTWHSLHKENSAWGQIQITHCLRVTISLLGFQIKFNYWFNLLNCPLYVTDIHGLSYQHGADGITPTKNVKHHALLATIKVQVQVFKNIFSTVGRGPTRGGLFSPANRYLTLQCI
jgi:hypothetical protein